MGSKVSKGKNRAGRMAISYLSSTTKRKKKRKKNPWKQREIKWPNILHFQLKPFFRGQAVRGTIFPSVLTCERYIQNPFGSQEAPVTGTMTEGLGERERESSSFLASAASRHLLSSYNRARWRPVIGNVIHSVSCSTVRKTKVIINISSITLVRPKAISIRWFH